MLKLFIYFFSLQLIIIIKCDLELRILKNIDEVYSPLDVAVVERVGTNFSLICELISTAPNEYDDQISWGRNTYHFSFKTKNDLEVMAWKKSKELYSFLNQSDINKATKYFSPSKKEDSGHYFCASFKYMIFKIIYVMVTEVQNKKSRQTFMDIYPKKFYCSNNMFMCQSNGACINHHYKCDGKKDCRDGSDESYENCLGDPCRDKLLCDDGRCIPRSWCCDKHYDSGCMVTFRPSCCQIAADSYSDYEYMPYDLAQIKTSGTRYLFIFLCILATFFSVVLMLLILSKLLLFAKKSNAPGPSNNLLHLQEIPLNQLQNNRVNYRDADYRARQSFIVRNLNTTTVLDPLLLTRENIRGDNTQLFVDNPPSYTEVVSNVDGGVCEPPPPYSSTEFLNENNLSNTRRKN